MAETFQPESVIPLKTFSSCWSYNVIFEQLDDPPHIHYLGSLAILDENVFIMGGEFSDTYALYYNETWEYEPDWNYRPLHMRDFTTATIDKTIFVFGGHDDKIEGPSENSVHFMQESAGIWIWDQSAVSLIRRRSGHVTVGPDANGYVYHIGGEGVDQKIEAWSTDGDLENPKIFR